MQVISNDHKREETEIEFSFEEFSIILSSLIEMYRNEHWLEDWELPARIGFNRLEIKGVIKQMSEIRNLSPDIAEKVISERHMKFLESLE